jgi:serine protease AprX
MTRSIGTVDRMRWMAAWGAAAAASLALTVAVHTGNAETSALQFAPSPAAGETLPAPIGSSSPLDPRIAAIAARHPARTIEVIVQFKAGVSAGRARSDVARAQGRVFGELHIINALAVKLSAARARMLAMNPNVHAVSLNAAVRAMGDPGARSGQGGGHRSINTSSLQTTYDQTMGVSGLWRAGIDGAGIGVAVIDTGIDGSLPDFQNQYGGGSRVVETAVTNPDATTATDSYGHGTDVAGIIAGNGNNLSPSDPLHGAYVGVAPRANLISIKASDENGNASVLDVIYGLQFAVDHRADYNIRVVNLSLDSRTPQSYTTDPLDAAAESAWMHGIVVVAAAGNRGDQPGSVSYAPANDPYVITVGAVDENGTASVSDDTIASWSSRGVTQDGFHKPDVYAPGAHIVSVLAPNSAFASMCPSCIVGGEYIRTSGTSMAAPMISGLVADMLQQHPWWTPNLVKGVLTSPSAAASTSIQEVDATKLGMVWPMPVADQGLTPNTLIAGPNGDINYSQSSWSQSSWSSATGPLSASFAQSSWSCSCLAGSGDSAGPSQSSWSQSSWSTSSWSTYFDQTSANG